MLLLLPLLIACGDEPLLPAATKDPSAPAAPKPSKKAAPPEPTFTLVEHADAVAAADLDGDGTDELIFLREGKITIDEEERGTLTGAVQAVARGDIDGDGREEALVATGTGRGHRDAPAQVWIIREKGAEKLWERAGTRNQVADLRVVDGRIFLAVFRAGEAQAPASAEEAQGAQGEGGAEGADSGENIVEGGWLAEGVFTPVTEAKLAMTQLPLPGDAVLVGRIYGDQPRSDGGLWLRRGGQETRLPTVRGVQTLAAADLDGEEGAEILVADGWHFQYAQRAEARLALLSGPDWAQSRTIARFPESYTIRGLEVIGDDPLKRAILATGSHAVHLLTRDALGWKDTKIGEIGETGNAVFARTADGPAALIAGQPSTLAPLALP